MAKAVGISYTSVQRIWRAHGLKPHLIKTFKVSRDKNFVGRTRRRYCRRSIRIEHRLVETFADQRGQRRQPFSGAAV
jgi:hypothetical protein